MHASGATTDEAKRELRRLERRLADVLESTAEYLLAIDREWRFTFVNRQMLEFLGKPLEEIVGRSLWELFPEARGTEFGSQYQRVMEERIPVRFEFQYAPNGRWLQVRAHPTDEGLTAYVMDIDDRKQAEAAVQRSERRFRALIENGADGIVITDGEGRVQSVIHTIMGYGDQPWTGRSIFDLLHPEDRPRVVARFAAMAQTPGAVLRGEYRTIHADRTWRWVDAISRNLLNDPDVRGIVLNYRDITERKNFEEQIRQTQKLESLGVLAGGIAHDFNNLLVGIMGHASLALDELAPSSPIRQSIEQVLTASEQAANLTRQMLAYSGRGQFIVEPVDLSELIREMANLLQASVPRTVEFRQELATGLPYIEADRTQIQQLVMNFVINGAEAIGSGPGTVTIRTGVEEVIEPHALDVNSDEGMGTGKCVVLEVQDTGAGMDDATARKIFDPFFTTKSMGRGLGLAAAQGIVRGHKAAIRIRTAPGQGTTFTVLFPSVAAPEPPMADQAVAVELSGQGTILVVDDEEIVQRLAKAALEHHGYQTLIASNGVEAIEILRKSPEVSLVLLDLSMPVMDGEQCWRELHAIRPEVPVVLSSGFSEADAIHRFGGQGLAGFLQKPYQIGKLAAIVKEILAV